MLKRVRTGSYPIPCRCKVNDTLQIAEPCIGAWDPKRTTAIDAFAQMTPIITETHAGNFPSDPPPLSAATLIRPSATDKAPSVLHCDWYVCGVFISKCVIKIPTLMLNVRVR